MIRVGCCGFPRRHAEVFSTLSLLEVQKTFYKPPRVATARRWSEEAPEGFVFTLKAWQLITHEPTSPTYRRAGIEVPGDAAGHYGAFRATEEVFEAWERTREIADALDAAVVVFQCPASFRPTAEHRRRLRAFFGEVERDGRLFAWEPRGAWEDEDVRALCEELDLVHAVDPFARHPVTGSPAYLRLHGIGGYRYRYTGEDLDALESICAQHDEAWVLFNNDSMWEDALRFRERVAPSRTRR